MLNRAITIKLDDLINQVIDAYEDYAFDKVYRVVMPFIINDMSAFYLDFTKDRLYTSRAKDFERMSIQSTIYDVLKTLLVLLTPIMPHTMSEAYSYLVGPKLEDVSLERFPEKRHRELRPILLKHLEQIYVIRDLVNITLEHARNEKIINKSMQAKIKLNLTKEQMEAVEYLNITLSEILMVAEVDVKIDNHAKAELEVFEGETCDRCWNVFKKVNSDHLCEKCAHVMEAHK
jgi:isoleucyl-tRNA synthetase